LFIDFYGDWCGPCRKMDIDVSNTPEMKQQTDNIIMVKVDIDRYPHVASTCNITIIPRMMLIDPFENQIDEITGYQNLASMQRCMSKYPDEISEGVVALKALEGKENETAAKYLASANAYYHYIPSLNGKAKSKEIAVSYDIALAQSKLAIEQKNHKKALKRIQGLRKEDASSSQKKEIEELCIPCLFNTDQKAEAEEQYKHYASTCDTPKTFDKLIATKEN
jgi:thiol-disulfide isomerase/thioredoxin